MRRLMLCLVALICASVTPVGVPGAAAESANVPDGAVLVATATRQAQPGERAAAAVISCYTAVDNPHISSHVPGTINVVANIWCTAPMTRIAGILYLYRNGTFLTANGPPQYSNGTATFSPNTATPCPGYSATYQGRLYYTLYFPPGFTPSPQAGNKDGNLSQILC